MVTAGRNYRRGYMYEWRTKKALEGMGFLVVRSAGSRFPDLVAVKYGKVALIEVKSRQGLVDRATLDRLRDLGTKYGVETAVAYYMGGLKIDVVYTPYDPPLLSKFKR